MQNRVPQFHLGCKTPSGEEEEGAEGKEAGLGTEVEGVVSGAWGLAPGGVTAEE